MKKFIKTKVITFNFLLILLLKIINSSKLFNATSKI